MSYFKRSPISYRVVLATAVVMATLFLLQAYMHHFVYADLKDMGEFSWVREAPVPYLNFLFWALLTPLVFSILLRWPLSERPVWKQVLIHCVFAVLVGSVHEVTTSSIYYFILSRTGDFEWNAEYRSIALHALPPAILQRFMEYWTLLVVLIAVDNARQMREKQTQLLKLKSELHVTQLNALKKQLQPHFLFNTLNTVSALMDEDVNGARKVLSRLGQLLRVTLDKERRDKVELSREIDHIGNYLGIESVRFRDRLNVTYAVPNDCERALVPSMVLQPLVENAIKHGPDATSDRVDITVSAERHNGTLTLRVADNGKGCRNVVGALETGGIGLRNVRDRLRLLYGDDAQFDLASPGGRGFQVTLAFPFEPDPARP
ncbi:MAG TPA: histidine kinase [Flavobacteriales bacterium]|nr:histidine kinase [Flavobacteriales bacterium]